MPISRNTLAFAAAAACVLALGGCQQGKVREADLPLLVTIDDLEAYGYELSHLADRQVLRRVRYVDGSLDLESEFETPEGAEEIVYVTARAGFERTESGARSAYRMERGGTGIGMRVGGVTVRVDPGFFRWGDESYFGYLVSGGEPVGNVFGARRGTRTYSLIVAGLYFDDPREWEAFIGPKLKYLERYQPAGAPRPREAGRDGTSRPRRP